MSRVTNFIFGAILGSLVGSTLVLLLAPSSGEKLRTQMRSYITNLQDEIQKAADSKRVELETQLAALRSPRSTPPHG